MNHQIACRFKCLFNSTRLIGDIRNIRELKCTPRVCFNNNGLHFNGNFRFVSTFDTKSSVTSKPETSVFKKVLSKIPFIDFNKSKAQAIGYILYEATVDKLDYLEFFDKYELPDTFYSWFVITELHVWMWAVRTMAEGGIGRHIRNCLVEALWADASVRSKKLGASNPSVTRMQINMLAEQLQAALIAYDEGLQTNDLVLAGAVWRRFYQQNNVDPAHLDMLVKYIRIQLKALDDIPSELLLSKDISNWKPVKMT